MAKKKIVLPNLSEEDEHGKRKESTVSSVHTKATYMLTFIDETKCAVEYRKKIKVLDTIGDGERDVTPKDLEVKDISEKFEQLTNKIGAHRLIENQDTHLSESNISRSTVRMGGFHISMDDVMKGIGSSLIKLTDEDLESKEPFLFENKEFNKQFVKLFLTLTPPQILYEQNSSTVLKDTNEAIPVIEDNKIYDYLTIGKGKVRRISENDAQTINVLLKSRESQTTLLEKEEKGTYVSNYIMYETYSKLQQLYLSVLTRDSEVLAINNVQPTLDTEWQEIAISPSFQFAVMIITRLLASNEYEEGQRCFRNMPTIDHTIPDTTIKYSVNLLFRFNALSQKEGGRKAACCLSFCYTNYDIWAIGYGAYSAIQIPNVGHVCIFNIKNPNDSERVYNFNCPVVSLAFSPYEPNLLAVGLFDGSIYVFDISKSTIEPVSRTSINRANGVLPVMAITWLSVKDSDDPNEVESILALSQDSSVTKFRINDTPYLSDFKIMTLTRVEGSPEGLLVKSDSMYENALQANRNPMGQNMITHPVQADIYYILTDEGCIVKCSTNYAHQYMEILRVHDGCVQSMDFSPWSPKLFLTCGNDWYIRIWMVGIFRPLIELRTIYATVHCAFWSRTHSTIIMANNRVTFDIWDIRRNLLNPVSSTSFDSSRLTLSKLNHGGRTVGIGNNRGNVLVCSIEDMPKPQHYQYEDLEKALFKAIANDNDLVTELKTVGYFGY